MKLSGTDVLAGALQLDTSTSDSPILDCRQLSRLAKTKCNGRRGCFMQEASCFRSKHDAGRECAKFLLFGTLARRIMKAKLRSPDFLPTTVRR